MTKKTKWAEQCLVENTFRHMVNGKEVDVTMDCLNVCLTGKELYRKAFLEDKYRGKDKLVVAYDFIVILGNPGPSGGAFYMVEYTIGEYGVMYHALVQAVKPAEDLPLIFGTLKSKNIIPNNVKVHRAWKAVNIDAVCIGSCGRDEDGEAVFTSGCVEAKECDTGLLDYVLHYPEWGACLEYYRGDCKEVWTPREVDCSKEKIFVCGVNGDDPEFAERKAKDIDEMWSDLASATEVADDYGVNYFYIWQKDDNHFEVDCHGMTIEAIEKALEAMKKEGEENGNA